MLNDRLCRLVLRVLGVTFALVGVSFLAAPDAVVGLMNLIGRLLGPFPETPVGGARLWVSLSFAYMSVVAALALLTATDPPRYLHLLPILALGKLTSSLSGLGFFLLEQHAFVYLATFVVDGSIVLLVMGCWLFYRRGVAELGGR
ncbi:MAG: hypothetical protein HY303_05650 [Candidatus Wallbacteria bacterium]|nr:hypothetical protein [Candidatus Wallbacteria bacterium]